MRVSFSYCLFLALMLLLHHPVAALNWQGTGNLSSDNLTIIWDYIDATIKHNSDDNTLSIFCEDLSWYLNERWDPAWNVITARVLQPNEATYFNDMVFYGYAFRNHWMWFNGYSVPSISSKFFSFVIWKDYNCQGWKTVGHNAPTANKYTGFTTAQKDVLDSIILSFVAQNVMDDPWFVAKTIIAGVESSSQFVVEDNHAYSIAVSQLFYDLQLYGRVCVVDNGFYYSKMDYYASSLKIQRSLGEIGTMILFQTR